MRCHRSAVARVLCMVSPLACGPAPTDDADIDASTGEPATTSGADPTTGAAEDPPDPSVCLAPMVDGVAPATDALTCVAPDAGRGSFAFDFSRWPELGLPHDSYCEDTMVDVTVACMVRTIAVDGDATSVGLRCADADGEHDMGIAIDVPWLRFPVCQGDMLEMRYYRYNYGCGYGGHSETLVLRDAVREDLLAASFDGSQPDWLAPIQVEMLPEAGCDSALFECVKYTPSAMRFAVDDGPAVTVYDSTRRIVDMAGRYLVQVDLVWVEEWDGCGDNGWPPRLELVRAEP